ncbi:MAG: site-specific integrase [Bdellovibrionales bacterium]|nr:site-specific integrase [Bdellovibrionales bacterium]
MAVRKITVNGKENYEVYINTRDARGLRVQKRWRGFNSLRAAHEAELKLKAKALNEREQGPRWLWEEWLRHYIGRERLVLRGNTIRHYETSLEKWATPQLRGRFIDEVTPREIHEVVHKHLEEKSAYSKKGVLRMIRRVFAVAVEEGALTKNPCAGISVKVSETKQSVLSQSEVDKLLREAKMLGHRFYEVWAMAVFTGMRSGELFATRWHDVDLESGRIYVTRSWSSVDGFGPTKSRRNRIVPISGSLRKLLIELKMRQGADSEFVLPHLWEWEKGEQARVLRSFCKSIGITPVKFHDLRATFITQLLLKGVPLAQVMSIVGHSEIKTTNRYLRVLGTDLDGVTEKLGFSLPQEQVARVIDFKARESS